MTPATPSLLRLPRALVALPLLVAAGILPGCSDRALDPSAIGRRDPAYGYGTWRPALSEVPKAISESDADIYRRIAQHQQRQEWAAADQLIGQAAGPLAARPRACFALSRRRLFREIRRAPRVDGEIRRPSRREPHLRNWARARAGRRAARSARAAAPSSASVPTPPKTPRSRPLRASRSRAPTIAYRAYTRRGVGTVQGSYQLQLRRGNYESAEAILNGANAERALGATRVDTLKTELAIYYLQSGKFDRAYTLAQAATRSRDAVPNAPWVAGLAGGRPANTARPRRISNTWPATPAATTIGRRPAPPIGPRARRIGRRLRPRRGAGSSKAAGFSRTLYGMIARHRLGIRQDFNFGVAMQPDSPHLARIGDSPEGKRAFGLIQIGMVAPRRRRTAAPIQVARRADVRDLSRHRRPRRAARSRLLRERADVYQDRAACMTPASIRCRIGSRRAGSSSTAR